MQIITRQEAKAKGLKHYYTGKPCKRGHVYKRFVSTCLCVKCAKLFARPSKGIKATYHPFCKIVNDALASTDRKEFRIKYNKSYMAASKRGILDLLTKRMPPPQTRGKWDRRAILVCAAKYRMASDWCSDHPGAYDAAQRLGILSEATAHMERDLSDYDAVYIWGCKSGNEWLCKVGVTSVRLGYERIKSVSKKSGIACEFAIIAKSKNALQAEALLKKIGKQAGFGGFNGSTEFRLLNAKNLKNANEVIYEYADTATH